jgi:anti-sigma factor RsiW
VNCIDLVELITEYLEDALPAPERAEIDAHLSECDGCTAYLEGYRATIRLTGMLSEEQITPEARAALRTVFRGWSSARP